MKTSTHNLPREAERILASHGINAADLEGSINHATWRELHQNRANARRAINSISENAGDRELTPDEKAAFDLCGNIVSAATSEIDNREANGNRDPHPCVGEMLGPNRQFGGGRAAGMDYRQPEGALRPDQRVEDRVGFDAGVSSDIGLGSILKAKVTGDASQLAGMGIQATQGSGDGSLGGFLVPTHLSARIIDQARARARVIEAGAMTIPIDGPTSFAAVESGPTAHWRGENAEIEESDIVLGSRNFEAQTLAVLVRSSVELIEDAGNAGALIESEIAAELALKLDRMCLIGHGVGQPLGLFNTDGVHRIPVNGPLTDFSPLSRAVQQVRDANAEPGDFILSARTDGELDRLTDEDNNPLRAPRSVAERRLLATNQIPNDLGVGSPPTSTGSAIFTGQWSDYYIAVRTGLVLEISRVGGDAFKKMQVLVRGYLRADAFAVRPGHFAVIDGIEPPAE